MLKINPSKKFRNDGKSYVPRSSLRAMIQGMSLEAIWRSACPIASLRDGLVVQVGG